MYPLPPTNKPPELIELISPDGYTAEEAKTGEQIMLRHTEKFILLGVIDGGDSVCVSTLCGKRMFSLPTKCVANLTEERQIA